MGVDGSDYLRATLRLWWRFYTTDYCTCSYPGENSLARKFVYIYCLRCKLDNFLSAVSACISKSCWRICAKVTFDLRSVISTKWCLENLLMLRNVIKTYKVAVFTLQRVYETNCFRENWLCKVSASDVRQRKVVYRKSKKKKNK